MGLKQSKTVRLLKEQGVMQTILYCLHKFMRSINNCKVSIVLSFYPKCTLNKSQLALYRLIYGCFKENYKNIIALNPMFFIKNFKKHIAWLESQEFKKQYGDIRDFIDSHIKHINMIASLQTDMIPPPPYQNTPKLSRQNPAPRTQDSTAFYTIAKSKRNRL